MNESFRDNMDERNERFKKRIEDRWGHKKRGHGRLWTGLLLLVIGGLLLLKTANILIFPSWFFTTPVLLIAIGLFFWIKTWVSRTCMVYPGAYRWHFTGRPD